MAEYSHRVLSVPIYLPRKYFLKCVTCIKVDDCRERIFVEDPWLQEITKNTYSLFCLIDIVDIKKKLVDNTLATEKLSEWKLKINNLAEKNPEFLFISFSDNILIQFNFSFIKKNNLESNLPLLLQIIKDVQQVCIETLKLDIYAILSYGANVLASSGQLPFSKNYISLNILGDSFSRLFSIDGAVRLSIKNNKHELGQCYIDSFLHNYLHGSNQGISFDYNHTFSSAKEEYYLATFLELRAKISRR